MGSHSVTCHPAEVTLPPYGVCVCLVPVVRVSSVAFLVVESRAAQLTWSAVACNDRLGLQSRYDLLVVDNTTASLAVNMSTRSVPPLWLRDLRPYTQYTVRVRYANQYGPAPYSGSLQFTTLQDGM